MTDIHGIMIQSNETKHKNSPNRRTWRWQSFLTLRSAAASSSSSSALVSSWNWITETRFRLLSVQLSSTLFCSRFSVENETGRADREKKKLVQKMWAKLCPLKNPHPHKRIRTSNYINKSTTHRGLGTAAEAANSTSTPSPLFAHHLLSGTWASAVTGSRRATWPSDWGLSGQKASFVIWTKERVKWDEKH